MNNTTDYRRIMGLSGRTCALIFAAVLVLTILFVSPVSAGEIRIGQTSYYTISDALSAADDGATIIITGGTYTGSYVIDKSVQLIGVPSETGAKPRLNTARGDVGITLKADDITIRGFEISGEASSAILVTGNNAIISENDILATPIGITLYSSAGTTVSDNLIKSHRLGIYIDGCVDCDVYMNTFENIVNGKSLSTSVRWSTSAMKYSYYGKEYSSGLGNYWSDYYGDDTTRNGIGEVPYEPTSQSQMMTSQNQLVFNNINLQNLAYGRDRTWANLFSQTNTIRDSYPLITAGSAYSVTGPAAVNTDPHTTADPTVQPANPQVNPDDSRQHEERILLIKQSPFKIVGMLIVICGITAGLIAFLGGAGSLYQVRRKKSNEIAFFAGASFILGFTMLYTVISYTSRVIYQYADLGYLQLALIMMTEYLVCSSFIMCAGFARAKVPILLRLVHPAAAFITVILFFVSLAYTKVDLGSITSLSYPATLLLSAAVPLAFEHIFKETTEEWKKQSESGYNPKEKTVPYDDDTIVFTDENGIMFTSLGQSYFPDALNERYSNVTFIGKGGIARVFRAERRKDGVTVAVKVPINFDETTGRMFLKEMKIWGELNHPNIVTLYSANILPVPFVEMEYLPDAVSDMKLPLKVNEAYDIICGVADGLSYAHNRKIIHRDIKPQNILLSGDNTPKITDWGLGKVLGDGNDTTTIGFSLNYAAPEQIAPKKFGRPDERTDIYQLGILFYELVCGRKPFNAEGMAEMSDAILYSVPEKPSFFREENAVFDNIIMKMIEKEQEKRYASVDDIISDLEKLSRKMEMY